MNEWPRWNLGSSLSPCLQEGHYSTCLFLVISHPAYQRQEIINLNETPFYFPHARERSEILKKNPNPKTQHPQNLNKNDNNNKQKNPHKLLRAKPHFHFFYSGFSGFGGRGGRGFFLLSFVLFSTLRNNKENLETWGVAEGQKNDVLGNTLNK